MSRLRVGDDCPDFALIADDGSIVSNQALLGSRFALYFYPRDESPGCTTQACELRDEFEGLRDLNIEIVGVSPDTTESHRQFRAHHRLPFRLLSDSDHSLAESFGVWVKQLRPSGKSMGFERTTFIVGADGVVEAVLPNVHPTTHAVELITAVRALSVTGAAADRGANPYLGDD